MFTLYYILIILLQGYFKIWLQQKNNNKDDREKLLELEVKKAKLQIKVLARV